MRLENASKRAEYAEVNQILRGDLGIDFKFWIEWENLFTIDFSLLPHKVAVLVKLDNDYVDYDQTLEFPMVNLKAKILRGHFWEVRVYDYQELVKSGNEKYENIKKDITESFEATNKIWGNPENIKRLQNLTRLFRISATFIEPRIIRNYMSEHPDMMDIDLEADVDIEKMHLQMNNY